MLNTQNQEEKNNIMKVFYLKANANKPPNKLAKQTKKVIDYIQNRYSLVITGMDVGYIAEDFIQDKIRYRVFYEGDQIFTNT